MEAKETVTLDQADPNMAITNDARKKPLHKLVEFPDVVMNLEQESAWTELPRYDAEQVADDSLDPVMLAQSKDEEMGRPPTPCFVCGQTEVQLLERRPTGY